jgi:hypothetical protein
VQLLDKLLDRPVGNDGNNADLDDPSDGRGEDDQFGKHEE